jgi:hypothetical protein
MKLGFAFEYLKRNLYKRIERRDFLCLKITRGIEIQTIDTGSETFVGRQ